MAESKQHQRNHKEREHNIQALSSTHKIKESPAKARDALMEGLARGSIDCESLLATAAILAAIPAMRLSADARNQAFWDVVQREFIARHGVETDDNFDYKMPLHELADAVKLMYSLSQRPSSRGDAQQCEINSDFSQLAQRHCVRHGSSLKEESLEFFTRVMRLLVTSHTARGQLIKAIKDVCCNCLVDHQERLSHRGFADMCKVVGHLPLEAQSPQFENVLSAVEKYLQREIDTIEAGLMYSVARSMQVGNRASGGRPLSSLNLDVLLSSRIIKDQEWLLGQLRKKYAQNSSEGMAKAKASTREVGVLCSFIDCARRARTGPDGFDEARRAEVLGEAMGTLYLLRHDLPLQRLTWDLEWLSKDSLHNKEYEDFLLEYLKSNIGKLPLQQQVLLPKLMHKLDSESQQRAKDSLLSLSHSSESSSSSTGSLAGIAARNQVKVLQSFVEAEGKNVSEATKQMLQALFMNTGNIFTLKELVKTLDDYEVSRSGNEDLWDCIFEKAESHKSQVEDNDGFQKILLSLSNQGKEDPRALEQVSQLLHGVSVNVLTVEAVLQLRNNIVRHHPDRNDIQSALEMRAIGMLYKFGQHHGQTTLSSNQARIQRQLQAAKNPRKPGGPVMKAAGKFTRSLAR